MKFIFFTETSNSIGLGHITRIISLIQEVQYRKIEFKLYVFGNDIPNNIIGDLPYILISWHTFKVKDFHILFTRDDYVIVDSYIAPIETYQIMYSISKNILVIDDYGRLDYPPTLILNPSPMIGLLKKPYPKSSKIMNGEGFVLVRREFMRSKDYSLKKKVYSVLITLGGGSNLNAIKLIADLLINSFPSLKLNLLTNKSDFDLIKKTKEISLFSNLSAKRVSQLYLANDLVISASGQSIYELINLRVPFISVRIVNNQRNNSKITNTLYKFDNSLDLFESNFNNNLRLMINEFLDLKRRENLIKQFSELNFTNGSRNVINQFTSFYNRSFKFYYAKKSDSDNVLNLRNEESVRKFSKSNKFITKKHHLQWFYKEIKLRENLFLVIKNDCNTFLGQIRFQRTKLNDYIISVSLSEFIRGKGLSKQIVEGSIAFLNKTKNNYNRIIAYIHNENVASLKLFENLGFVKFANDRDFQVQYLRGQKNDKIQI